MLAKRPNGALGLLLEDQVFWQYISTPPTSDDRRVDPYSEVVVQYHQILLGHLGYVPPPPASELVDNVKKAIQQGRGAASGPQEIRQRIVDLKDRTLKQIGIAEDALRKLGVPGKKKGIGKVLAQLGRDGCLVISTAASVLALHVGQQPTPPPTPQDQPPAIVQPYVLPAPAPPGAERYGQEFFWRGLPPTTPPDSTKT